MNLISSYYNSTMSEAIGTKALQRKITTKSPSVIWVRDNVDNDKKVIGFSLKDIEKVRLDFKANFNNLRKYPKMTEIDWK